MKYMFSVILMAFAVNCVSAQLIIPKKIPLVKESLEVDSMLQNMMESTPPKAGCYAIDVRKKNEKYSFAVSIIDKSNSLIILRTDNLLYSPNLRFFFFDNCLVFVSGYPGPITLFKKAKYHKIFKFKINNDIIANMRELYTKFYNYDDGKISEDRSFPKYELH